MPFQYWPPEHEEAPEFETHAEPFQYWPEVQELEVEVAHAEPLQYCPTGHEELWPPPIQPDSHDEGAPRASPVKGIDAPEGLPWWQLK